MVDDDDKLDERLYPEVVSRSVVETFIRDGVVVVDDVLDEGGVARALAGFEATLRRHGVDTCDLSGSQAALRKLSTKGGVLDLFFEPWKLEATVSNERYAAAMTALLEATYGRNEGLWRHPYGPIDGVWAHIDRIGFRVPGRAQRALSPHLDCCPDAMHPDRRRWRPIQCLLSLAGGLGPNEGGFECLKGFHRRFDEYYARRRSRCVGDYVAITSQDDQALLDDFEHVRVPPGAAVFWDRRIPHANARANAASTPRQVIYGGYLPRGPAVNRAYVRAQLDRIRAGGEMPDDFWLAHRAPDDAKRLAPPPEALRAFLTALSPHAGRVLCGVDE